MQRLIIFLICCFTAPVILIGCSQPSDPTNVVMDYWTARVESDASRMQQLSCAAWEAQAIVQARSFEAMNAQLEDVSCRVVEQSEQQARVACDGRIITSYNAENREWELTPLLLVLEQGEWRICGEG